VFLYGIGAIRFLAMLINTTNSANTSTISMSATRSSIVSGFAHLIIVKLTTKENYSLWHAQFLPYLRSNCDILTLEMRGSVAKIMIRGFLTKQECANTHR
jgi:hypothetical protein